MYRSIPIQWRNALLDNDATHCRYEHIKKHISLLSILIQVQSSHTFSNNDDNQTTGWYNSVPIKVYLIVFLANHRCPCTRYCDDSRAILLCSRSCTIFCRRRDSISITVLPFCACGFSRSLTKYARVPTVKEKTISPVLFKATLQPLHFTVCFVADYAFTLRWDIGILQVLTWWKGWRKDSRAAARIVNSSQKSDMSCILWEYQ